MNWRTLPFERIVIYKSKIFAKRFKPGKSPKIWLKRASSLRIFLRQNPSIWVIVPWNLISVLMSYPNFKYSADLFSSAFPGLSFSLELFSFATSSLQVSIFWIWLYNIFPIWSNKRWKIMSTRKTTMGPICGGQNTLNISCPILSKNKFSKVTVFIFELFPNTLSLSSSKLL